MLPSLQFILMSLPSITLFLQLQVWRVKEALNGSTPNHATGPRKPDLSSQEGGAKKS